MRNFSYGNFSGINERFSGQISISHMDGVGGERCVDSLKKLLTGKKYNFLSAGNLKEVKLKSTLELASFFDQGTNSLFDHRMNIYGQQNHIIVEGRVPHIFMPYAFKVFLQCSIRVCAERRYKSLSKKGKTELTVNDVEQQILKTDRDDISRFESLYPECFWKIPCFDCVVDMERLSATDAAKTILKKHREWLDEIASKYHVVYGGSLLESVSA